MAIQRMCILTDRYPTQEYPINTFLDQLVSQFADFGINCTVIAPYSPIMDKIKGNNYHPSAYREKRTKNNNIIRIFSPRIYAVSGKKVFGINFAHLYQKQFEYKVRKIMQYKKIDCDVMYAHFIVPSGISAINIGKSIGVPAFVAYGESSISIVSNNFDLTYISRILGKANGIVAVSTENKKELTENRLIGEDKVKVFPNSIDSSVFYTKDKALCRTKLGIAEGDFVVIFVGHFNNRKGISRLSAALDKLSNVKSIFIGAGDEKPLCHDVIFSGRVPHDEVVDYLNAADVFVLPTLAEGCCNAIVEAMACGLPIVSSDLPFNDDILDDSCSFRINPNSIDEIADAIRKLQEDPELCFKMGQASKEKAKGLSLSNRASGILEFMKKGMK